MGLFDFFKRKAAAPANTVRNQAPAAAATPAESWNDEARDELRESLRAAVHGEIRLNRAEPATILQNCSEAYIEDQAPEAEWNDLRDFVSRQIRELGARFIQEQASWPAETDCDRMDQAEAELRHRGILLWQVAPCCDTCSNAELPDRIDVVEQRHPGLRQKLRGYAFFIDQHLPEMLAKSTTVSLYLAYGWIPPEGSDVADEEYAAQAVAIGQEIRTCLEQHDFEVEWNGELSRKIGLTLNWQRRTPVI